MTSNTSSLIKHVHIYRSRLLLHIDSAPESRSVFGQWSRFTGAVEVKDIGHVPFDDRSAGAMDPKAL